MKTALLIFIFTALITIVASDYAIEIISDNGNQYAVNETTTIMQNATASPINSLTGSFLVGIERLLGLILGDTANNCMWPCKRNKKGNFIKRCTFKRRFTNPFRCHYCRYVYKCGRKKESGVIGK